MPSWTCLLISALALFPEAGLPPTPAPPATLLAAPINATWAANEALMWRRRGFSGFVFRGIADTLPATTEEKLPFDEVLLEREVRSAVGRLADAGLDKNFFHCFLSPEDTWFSEHAPLERAASFFSAAGAFCKKTGLRGMALDTAAASLFYDHRWDGYALTPAAQERARLGAQAFGRRILRAFIRECPDADIFILVDDLPNAGRLWFDLLQGFAEAPGAADTVRLHLVLRGTAQLDGPAALRRAHDALSVTLDDRLPQESARWWREHGRTTIALEPLGYEGDQPVAFAQPDHFRVLHAAALTLSDDFVWIEAPAGGWWSIGPEEPARYAHLKQGGAASVGNVRPLYALWADYNVNSPLRDLRRVGPWPDGGGEIDVFAGPRGAAAIFWDGLGAPLEVPNRFVTVLMTELAKGEPTEYFPHDGKITLPATEGPVLLSGLPHADWTVPAGLWADPLPDPERPGRAVVRYGWRNQTGEPLTGELRLDPPARLGAGGAFAVVDTQGNADIVRETHLLGSLSPTEPLSFRLAFLLAGGKVHLRTVHQPVLPQERWRYRADGPLRLGPPFRLAANANAPSGIVFASPAGDVGLLDDAGAPRWVRRFRGDWAAGPANVLLGTDTHGILLVDHRGFMRCLNAEGAVLWEIAGQVPSGPGGLLAGDLFLAPYDGILLLAEDGTLQCMLPDGRRLWAFPFGSKAYVGRYDPARAGSTVPNHATATGIGQRIFVATAGDTEGSLFRLDTMGHRVWQRALPAPASTAPLVYPLDGEPDFGVAVGLGNGTVIALHANSGTVLKQWDVAPGMAITDLLAVPLGLPPTMTLLTCSAVGFTALGEDGAQRWSTPIAGALGSTLAITGGVPHFYVHDTAGHLTQIHADGSVAWQCDLRAAGAPLLQPNPRTGHTLALVPTTTGLLRQLNLEATPPVPVNRAVASSIANE